MYVDQSVSFRGNGYIHSKRMQVSVVRYVNQQEEKEDHQSRKENVCDRKDFLVSLVNWLWIGFTNWGGGKAINQHNKRSFPFLILSHTLTLYSLAAIASFNTKLVGDHLLLKNLIVVVHSFTLWSVGWWFAEQVTITTGLMIGLAVRLIIFTTFEQIIFRIDEL